MTRAIRPTLLLVVAVLAIAAALLITGALRNGPTVAGAATRHHKAVHRTHVAKKHGGARTAAANGETPGTETADSGTAEVPDSGTAEVPDAGEAAGSEPAGETADGHRDAQGEQVDHQCPPDCADGETP